MITSEFCKSLFVWQRQSDVDTGLRRDSAVAVQIGIPHHKHVLLFYNILPCNFFSFMGLFEKPLVSCVGKEPSLAYGEEDVVDDEHIIISIITWLRLLSTQSIL